MNRFVILTSFLASIIGSCDQSPLIPRSSLDLDETPSTEFRFPTGRNSMWEYAVEDTVQGTQDTVLVRLLGPLHNERESRSAFLIAFRDSADTTEVVRRGDTLWLRLVEGFYGQMFVLAYPLRLNKYWNSSFGVWDSVRLVTPAGTFNECAVVVHSDGYHHDPSFIEYWVQPDIGVVKIEKRIRRGTPTSVEIWTLLSYYIAP